MNTIIHVPHSSLYIPDDIRNELLTNDLSNELLLMTDIYCDDLFFNLYSTNLIYPYSRLVCDVERFRSADKESMEKYGMGAIYTKCHDGSILRELSKESKEEKLKRYYDFWHDLLNDTVRRDLEYGKVIIIDGHSFSPVPLPHEEDKSERPDICIGTDEFHTPPEIERMAVKHFERIGYTVSVNSPFSGCMVPSKYYKQNKNVLSIMIEVNRSIYTNNNEKLWNYRKVKMDIQSFIDCCKAM